MNFEPLWAELTLEVSLSAMNALLVPMQILPACKALLADVTLVLAFHNGVLHLHVFPDVVVRELAAANGTQNLQQGKNCHTE